MQNKRGQGLSITTIILIVLGVLVLVVLILGFTIGWQKIFPFISPSNNVGSVVDKCSLALNTDSKFDYCSVKREVKVEEAIGEFGTKFKGTCYELSYVDVLGVNRGNIDCDYDYASEANDVLFAELVCESKLNWKWDLTTKTCSLEESLEENVEAN